MTQLPLSITLKQTLSIVSNPQPLISILIPCYNVAPWLHRCLDSVLAQTYTNWEAICVNDGSFKDNTAEILEEYAAKDARFKVIHQENRGLSGARNTGLRHMTGEWMTWLDADDALNVQHIENLYSATNGCDMVISRVLHCREDGRKYVVSQIKSESYTRKRNNEELIEILANKTSSCLFRSEIISSANLHLKEDIVYAEDLLFYLEALASSNNINTIASNSYLYYIRDSISSVHNAKGTVHQEIALFTHLQRAVRELITDVHDFNHPILFDFLCRVITTIYNGRNSRTKRIQQLQLLDIPKDLNITTGSTFSAIMLWLIRKKYYNLYDILRQSINYFD